jgi:uncharacterized protein YgiB involved in biofilm formation
MAQKPSHKTLRLLAICASSIALTACGGEEPAKKAPLVQHIITSAVDCSESAALSYEDCSKIIESAVADHDQNAEKFSSLKACETSEGADKCERVDEKAFRPKLVAFLLTMSDPPKAEPLYATTDGVLGFRGADSTSYASDDDKYRFSKSALHAAELIGTAKKEG